MSGTTSAAPAALRTETDSPGGADDTIARTVATQNGDIIVPGSVADEVGSGFEEAVNASSNALENTSSTNAELRALQQEMDALPSDLTMPLPVMEGNGNEDVFKDVLEADGQTPVSSLGESGVLTVYVHGVVAPDRSLSSRQTKSHYCVAMSHYCVTL